MRLRTVIASAALCSAFAIQVSHAALIPVINTGAGFKSAININAESVGDQVDYSPNLIQGGFATPEKRSRYRSARLEYVRQQTPNSLVSVSVSQRQVNSLRDAYEINQLEANALFRLSPSTARYSVDVGFDALFNHSDRLSKNSYTTYDGNVITRSSIDNPQDQTLAITMITGLRLGRGFSVQALSGGGLTHSDHDSVNGVGSSSDGCQYAFSTDGSVGSLDQLGSCGAVVSYQQTFASEQGVEDRLGFRASRDISYLARFVQTGAQLSWSSSRVAASLGYRYRRYFRGSLDQNIEAEGRTPVRVSQLLNAEISYKPSVQWKLSFSASYHSAPFLDDVPLLYTAFTSDRYNDTKALSLGFGVSWYFGRRVTK